MNKIETKEDIFCSFLAYLRSKSMNIFIFKPVELADMRSKFNDLQIRCNYNGNKVIFTVEGEEAGVSSNNIEVMLLIEALKSRPVMLEQDWVLLFCMAVLREDGGRLVLNRNQIEIAREFKKINLKLTYFEAEDQFTLSYERKSELILN